MAALEKLKAVPPLLTQQIWLAVPPNIASLPNKYSYNPGKNYCGQHARIKI